jgi:heme-degrading monooxygenase HmoA
MHARVSTVRFQAGGEDEALHIFRDIMLPSASKQKGFKGALILKSDADPEEHIVISLWKTEEAMLESRAPEDLVPQLEPLEQLIAENKQGTYEVLLHME